MLPARPSLHSSLFPRSLFSVLSPCLTYPSLVTGAPGPSGGGGALGCLLGLDEVCGGWEMVAIPALEGPCPFSWPQWLCAVVLTSAFQWLWDCGLLE